VNAASAAANPHPTRGGHPGIVGFLVHDLFWLFILVCVLVVLTVAAPHGAD
jgi:hypothetical protein